ncbi:hypothetical protein EXIGLDRAFT_833082 [Exidia glandulosa HHB12029]|uniref:Uncharacterized protein n=1 Tax=Exidia glandulosa HHB12029 TaxID=1314781 RepID=A0A165KYB2_EXIGL|nr:hypothetical protein EXIGLDRAFT_833082 [Exidia glandulosa HHB12029]
MDSIELSEENPAPPKPAPVRARYAIQTRREAVAHRVRRYRCLGLFLPILILCHGVLAVLVYYYSQAEAYPLPRGVINRNRHGLQAFAAFAYMLGIFVGISDGFLLLKYSPWGAGYGCVVTALFYLLFPAAITGLAFFFILSPLIFTRIRQSIAYKHACADDWVTVLLTGHQYNALDMPNSADFALSTAPPDVLFTFRSQNPDADVFGLVSASVDLGVPTPMIRPELRNITYDFNARTFSAFCLDDSTLPCATGTYDDRSFLTFDVSVNGTRTLSRSLYKEWSKGNVVSIILYHVDAGSGALTERILQTSGGNCPNLKVCLPRDVARLDGVIAAETLVPLGWMLHQQSIWTEGCTRPSTG